MDYALNAADPSRVIDLLEEWIVSTGCKVNAPCDHVLCSESREAITELETTLALARIVADNMRRDRNA